jgi:hypothetical protein
VRQMLATLSGTTPAAVSDEDAATEQQHNS